MSRKAFILILSLTLAACAAFRAQHGAVPQAEDHHHDHHAMHPPSPEFTEMSDGEQIARVRGEVEEAKKNLERQGRYACCVRPSCNECLLRFGECRCREAVREAGPCCGECTEAWVEGRGAVEGVSAWELLERKKQQIREREEGGGKGEEEKPPQRHHRH